MKTSVTRVHLTHRLQILAVGSTPATDGIMKNLNSLTPPVEVMRSAADDAMPFKIILADGDPGVVELVKQAREARHPASLAILDLQTCSDWDAEHLVSALLTADPALQLILLTLGRAPLGTRLVSLLTRCNRLAVLKTPFDEVKMSQLVRVMLAKRFGDRTRTTDPQGIKAIQQVESEDLSMEADSTFSANDLPGPSINAPTVLAVEDDETVLWMMSRVITATNAEDGWQKWKENINTIKLVISDINMPGGPNGVALGHAIQNEDGSVPVIYTSGHRAVQEFAELRPGANYRVKPFRMDDLLDIVRRAITTHDNHGLNPPLSRLVTWTPETSASRTPAHATMTS